MTGPSMEDGEMSRHAVACAGCGVDRNVDGTSLRSSTARWWCEQCCPALWCEACLSATGGVCRAHLEPEPVER